MFRLIYDRQIPMETAMIVKMLCERWLGRWGLLLVDWNDQVFLLE
jgi:hypothetical protein